MPTLDRRPGRPAFHHQGPPTAPLEGDQRTPKGPAGLVAALGLQSSQLPPALRDSLFRRGLADMISRRQGGGGANGGTGGHLLSMLGGGGVPAVEDGPPAGLRRAGIRVNQQELEESAAALRPTDSLQPPGRRRFLGGPSAMKYQQV